MSNRMRNKTVLVSGGATGMGRAAVELFSKEGAKVAVIDVNEEKVLETVAMVREHGGEAKAWVADVSDRAAVLKAVSEVEDWFGSVNALFNHAGSIIIKPFLETTLDDWEWLNAVNVRSMFLMTQAVLPGMIKAGGGSIVCTSSISAVAATPMEVLYDTTKGAVHMFARAIATEFRDRNVRCNAVCPGFIRTPHGLHEIESLQSHGVDMSDDAIRENQGRIGEPEDVARAVLYLASDDSQFVTGTHLFVDNGFTAI